jgi:hypothetical protein
LCRVYLTALGWKAVVDDEEIENQCTAHDIFVIQLKCKYLAVTLTHALTHYSSTINFSDICKYAIEKVNQLKNSRNFNFSFQEIGCLTGGGALLQRSAITLSAWTISMALMPTPS